MVGVKGNTLTPNPNPNPNPNLNLGQEEEHRPCLLNVEAQVANLLQVVDVEEDGHGREQVLDAALDHRTLVLAGRPHVREEGVVLLARVQSELRLLG